MKTAIQGKNWTWRLVMTLTVLLLCFGICKADAAAKVTISKSSITINKGKTYRLKISGTNSKVTWKSGNRKVAKVNAYGKVTGKGRGTTIVTATVDGKTYLCSVKVRQKVTSVTLNKSKLTITAGKTKTLTATVAPTNANNRRVTWTSGNSKVATVTADGKVTAIKAGTAIITVKAKDGSGKKATCKVTVKAANTTTNNDITSIETAKKNATPSAKALKLLKKLAAYSKQIQADYKAGNPWRYGLGDIKPFSKANSEKKVVNCGSLTRWALIDIGVMSKYDHLWPSTTAALVFKNKDGRDTKATLLKTCNIYTVDRTGSEMILDGTLVPGDMCFSINHAKIYAGNGLWYESGRVGTNGFQKNGKYYFTTVGPVKSTDSEIIQYIIRLK